MTTTYFDLSGGNFTQNWTDTNLITADDNWSNVPSIMGFLADTTSASSYDPRLYTTDAGLTTDVVANGSVTTTNGGVIEVSGGTTNPTIGVQGSNAADVAGIILYLNATGRESVTFSANLRDLDASADASVQPIVLQYRVGSSGAWTELAYIADASGAGATQVTPISAVLPAAANNAAQVQVRVLTGNAAGSDELIGIDDISVTSVAQSGGGDPQPGTFSVADASVFEGDGGGSTAISFVVTRSGGSDGEVSVDYAFTLPGGTGGANAADFTTTPPGGTLTFAAGETTKTVTLQIAADDIVEPSETFTLTMSSPTGGATIADGSATGSIVTDDISVTAIHDIQGTAFFSPILAAEGITAYNQASAAQVTVSGVVTAIDSFAGSGVQGFYISEEVADWDGDSRTSEGIFVRTSGPVAGLTVGEQVSLTANVMEFQDFSNLPKTMLVNPINIAQVNNSVALPTLVLDGTDGKKIPNAIISDDNPDFKDSIDDATDTFDPQNDALDFYETIEGMRVTVPDMVVGDGFVGGSNDNFVYFNAYSRVHADAALLNSRGGYTIAGDPQHYPVDTATSDDDVKFGGATVHDGAQHGDILELDFGNVGRGGAAGFDQDLTMGDSLGDVTGILDFDFGVTKLYVTDALDPAKVAALDDTTPGQETTTLVADARALRVATFNVENLSPVGTTFSTNNGVEISTQAKYDALAANVATNLRSPDIIVIEEVQDNNGVTQDGVTDASTTWGQLVAAVNAATGKTYQWVDEAPATSGDVGGAPGGNIRVGFLYDTARVQLGSLTAEATLAERRAYTDVIGDGVRTAGDLIAVDDAGLGINAADWSGTRRSIVGEFNFNGQTIYVLGSHLPSKGGSGEPYQLNQNNAAGQPTNGDWALRSTLAEDLYAVQSRITTTLDKALVSAGDFNEFWFNRPLEVLTGYANTDGTARVGGPRYANLMVDKLAAVDRFSYDFDGRSQALDTIVADQRLSAVASFDAVHINTGYNDRAGAVNPATSDHDPSLASFDLRSFAETLTGTVGNDVIQGFGGNDTIDGGDGSDTAVFADSWVSSTVTSNGANAATIVTPAEGTDTVSNVETLRFAGVDVATADAVNDAPIGVNDSNASDAVVEDGDGSAAGNVLDNDTDADANLGIGETKTVTGVRAGTEAAGGTLTGVAGATVINGTYGQLTISADGSYSYALDNARAATQALNAGQTGTDSFTYRVADAHGLTDAAQLDVSIAGANDVAPRFTLQLLHLSDGEAGLLASSTAKNLAALADAFEDQYANSITLSGGDNFLPGPFLAGGTDPSLIPVINATTGSTISTAPGSTPAPGVVDTAIHNIIGVEASGIGNHEWDLGSNVYLSSIAPGGGWVGANYASISANLVLAPAGQPADPLAARFTQTVGTGALTNEEASDLKGRIAPSAIIREGGETIGLVGATTQILESISSPTGAEILGFPFGPGANGENNNMVLLAQQLQPVIDDLRAQGVNKIILMSHLQQIDFEKALAPLLTGVDIILAAGSNTRLGDADDVAVAFPGHEADFADTYPIVTAGADGKTTLIVNTDGEYTYLGRLVVDFDQNGDIVLDSVTDNVAINGAYASTAENVAAAWNTTIDNLEATAFAEGTRGDKVRDLTDAVQNVINVKDGNIYGYSNVYLEGERVQVRNQETNLGDVSADANADAARDALGFTNDQAIVSIKNGGGIRAQIGTIIDNGDGTVTKVAPEVDGEVSQLDVENALRFDNKLMVFDTTAQGLLNILNSPNALAPNNGGFIQIGGVNFSYDPTKPAGSRVQDIVLVNENGQITAVIADNGVVNPNAPSVITAVALNFTANGGDGYVVKANADNFRYLLNDGTLSAPVSEALDFTAPANVPANAIGEQQAFAEYFQERYGTRETAYNQADTGQALDTRIQNQAVRTDTVLQGDYLILGTAAGETLTGTAGPETLKALGGNDTINAGDGNDVLNGGTGADRLNGGTGIDTVTYVDAASGVAASLATARGSFGEAIGDRLTGIENLTGSAFGDVLDGNGQVNLIRGGGGNDVISGNGGLDQLFGDAGDDTFVLYGTQVGSIDGGSGLDTITVEDDNAIIRWSSFAAIEAISGDGYANVTIAGSVGVDTIDLTGVTLTDIAAINAGGGNDVVTGSVGADRINGQSGNDTLNGAGGADVINGGTGVDQLTGGAAGDRFVFAKADSGRTVATADTIVDFIGADGDRIDLSGIDAISSNGAASNDAFAFIGTAAFSRVAGQLRYEVTAGNTFVSSDLNGDAKADFIIQLVGTPIITADYFLL